MPTELQFRAWTTAFYLPAVVLVVVIAALLALAVAAGVTPEQLYADPMPPNVM
jgi:hypothetical protein